MIVSCGESLIDFVPRDGDNSLYRPCPGGSPFNLAVAAARLGAPSGFLGKISRDFFGDMLYDRLLGEGVDVSLVSRSDRPTTLAFVKVDAKKEPRYAFFTENSADRNLVSVDIPGMLPETVGCLAFGSISLLLEPEAATIKNLVRREAGRRTLAFDPNIRPMLIGDKTAYTAEMESLASLSTIVKVSAADLSWLYPGRGALNSAEAWLSLGAGVVVMTRGKDGGILLTPSYRVEVGEYWVEVKDSIGAGDTFHAALLTRLHEMDRLRPELPLSLERGEATEALAYAVKASSLNCAREGADPPRKKEM